MPSWNNNGKDICESYTGVRKVGHKHLYPINKLLGLSIYKFISIKLVRTVR